MNTDIFNHNLDRYYLDDDYNKKIYFPIVYHTHKINLGFHKAFLCIENNSGLDKSKMEINTCYKGIDALILIITNEFDFFLKKNIKTVFKRIQEKVSKKEQYSITEQVLKALKFPNKTVTNDIGNLSGDMLGKIREKLLALSRSRIAPQEYYAQLQSIHAEYTNFLAMFNSKNYPQKSFSTNNTIPDMLIGTFVDCVTNPSSAQQTLFSKKRHLVKKLSKKENPHLNTSWLQTISTQAYLYSWIPFLDTKYVIRKIITLCAGQEAYDELKKSNYFKSFRLLHKNNIIRLKSLFTLVYNLLETKPARFIIDKEEGASFTQLSSDLQESFFIDLFDTINKAHRNSIAMIQSQNRFSFVLKKQEIEDNLLQPKAQISHQDSSLWTEHNIAEEFSIGTEAIDKVINTLKNIPTNLNKIKSEASHIAQSARDLATSFASSAGPLAISFASSMLPWYTPPTPLMTRIHHDQSQTNAPKPIIQQPEIITGNIEDFVSKIHDINEDHADLISAHRISLHQKFSGEPHMKSFMMMTNAHEELIRNMKIQYRLYSSRNKSVPPSWSELSLKIDALYNSLAELKQARKKLRFFNIWGKIINSVARNNTIKSLKEHIAVYNRIKIKIYRQNHEKPYKINSTTYQKIREEFTQHCKFSDTDNINLFTQATREKSPYKQYLNVFNPLEQAELWHYIK